MPCKCARHWPPGASKQTRETHFFTERERNPSLYDLELTLPNSSPVNVWVTNNKSKTVTELQGNNGRVVGTYAVGHGPFGVAFDGANIWVANFFSKSVMKLAVNGTVVSNVAVGDGLAGITFAGGYLWVANNGSNTVSKLDPGAP
jgi:hypothetical protein